jgi:hypothetical protein
MVLEDCSNLSGDEDDDLFDVEGAVVNEDRESLPMINLDTATATVDEVEISPPLGRLPPALGAINFVTRSSRAN